MTDDDKRKSKRASRLMESYQETPGNALYPSSFLLFTGHF